MSLATLLVEDSKTIRETLIPAMGELAGLEVVGVAESPAEAIRLLAQFQDRWQVAIVDLFLKEGSGLEVLRACRERAPHQRVIVLTNYATADMRRRCLDYGADRVFDKSTELEDFFDYCSTLTGP